MFWRRTRASAPPATSPMKACSTAPSISAAACAEAFRASKVDICADVPTESLADLKVEFGPALHVAPYAGTYFYVFNTARPPFDDPRVRRALALAVDREALAKSAWSGGMIAATGLVPPGLSAAPSPVTGSLADRRAEARPLLAEAGFGKPADAEAPAAADKSANAAHKPTETAKPKTLAVEIRVGTGSAHEETAKQIAADWETVGVTATIRTEPNAALYERLRDHGEFDVARAGWIVDEPDALDMLTLLRGDNERFNYSRYADGAFDSDLRRAATEQDAAARSAALAEAEATLARDMPVLPLLYYASLSLVSPRVAGWQDNVLNLHPSRFLAPKP